MIKHERHTTRAIRTTASIEAESARIPEFGSVELARRIAGIGRTSIYKGIADGHFKSVFLREPGAKNGRRLIHIPGLIAYLHSLASDSIDGDRSQHGAALRKKATP